MSGGGATAGGAGVNDMVGAYMTRPREGIDGDGHREIIVWVRGGQLCGDRYRG